MDYSVVFRDFVDGDIHKVYEYKNDVERNSMIVGAFRPMTIDDARKWVEGCKRKDVDFRFWAVADKEHPDNLIGWISLSQIDKENNSACLHSIFIGNRTYSNGILWIEMYLFILNYAFNELHLHRLWGTKRADHLQSMAMSAAMFFHQDGILRESKRIGDSYIDTSLGAILESEYFEHLQNGDYELSKIIRRVTQYRKMK